MLQKEPKEKKKPINRTKENKKKIRARFIVNKIVIVYFFNHNIIIKQHNTTKKERARININIREITRVADFQFTLQYRRRNVQKNIKKESRLF